MSEKRVDPEDGKSYTFDELQVFYAKKYKKHEVKAYWESTCTAIKGKAKAKAKVKAEKPQDASPKAKAKAEAKTFQVKRTWKEVAVGDTIHDIQLDTGFPPEKIEVSDRCKGKKVIIIGIPGAFTPTWQEAHIPSYVKAEDDLKKKDIAEVIVMAVNDACVMGAFRKASGVKEDSIIKFFGDPSLTATKKLGVVFNIPLIRQLLGGPRCKRFAMVVDNGKVKHVVVANGEDVKDEETYAPKIMEHL